MYGPASFGAILVGHLSACQPLQRLVEKYLLAKEIAGILQKEGSQLLLLIPAGSSLQTPALGQRKGP